MHRDTGRVIPIVDLRSLRRRADQLESQAIVVPDARLAQRDRVVLRNLTQQAFREEGVLLSALRCGASRSPMLR